MGVGDAGEAAAPDVRAAARGAVAVDEGVLLDAERSIVVLGAPVEGVGVHDEAVRSGRRRDGAVAPVVDGRVSALDLSRRAVRGHHRRHALVLDAHHAADGLRAVAQACRAADHLHHVGAVGIDRDGVVLADVGHVARGDAVLLDAHPVIVEAADNRPVGAGREGRAGDAGLVLERVGDRRAAGREYLALGRDCRRQEGCLGADQRPRRRQQALRGRLRRRCRAPR